jgi:hypothetical protein
VTAPDGPDRDPVAEPVTQTGRPPVPPRPVPAGAGPEEGAPAGQHATERVPFPLPPLDRQGAPAQDPETGQLDLGGYPPRVPGAGRRPVRDEPGTEGRGPRGR